MKISLSPYVKKYLWYKRNTKQVPLSDYLLSTSLLKKIEQLSELTGAWNPVELLTPSLESIASAKTALMNAYAKNSEYNPVFEYPHVHDQLFSIREAEALIMEILTNVHTYKSNSEVENIAQEILLAKVNDDLSTVQLIRGLQEKSETLIHAAIGIKYPHNNEYINSVAESVYTHITQIHKETLSSPSYDAPLLNDYEQHLLRRSRMSAEEIKKAFEWILQAYGMLRSKTNPQGYRVTISPNVTHIDVRDKSIEPMTIFIPKWRVETADNVLSLMYHEIEAHVRQSMNGWMMFRIGGGILKVDDETLYEGLAKRMDSMFRSRFFGKKTGTPMPFYALAVQKAEEGASFYTVFSDQVTRLLHFYLKIPPHLPVPDDHQLIARNYEYILEYAWQNTFRVMRGHFNTVNATRYAFTKDLGYLRGWIIDKQLVEAGYGFINEAAVLPTNSLPMIGKLLFKEQDLPFPFKNYTETYCFDVLLPQLAQKAPYVLKKAQAQPKRTQKIMYNQPI